MNVAGSSTRLLDLAFHPKSGLLLVIDFGNARVLTVDPVSGATHVFTDLSSQGQPGLNVLTFDRAGNVYVSGSFSGAVYKTGPEGGPATTWCRPPCSRRRVSRGSAPTGSRSIARRRPCS